ncbi:MAG: FAD-dependent oxidoreductase [Bacteroidetes Order II. Incertae sedis bacterium]|jgi:CoA-dependent NAD(P)H sulfur oxidoreductase|nr:FAD-dependent oxidoreductase [Bacteroidetes Order II. bacterium]MBT4603016.1 FAD-dependent oxidoreductase [Bacteroidetes Order II. bacterium]MBT5250344.1 FAD-dependent oxidoreductase [Bacteroidetes Order II. bacterium]MBT6202052.1 FAD-dependent oxidoreductase [Bacteroidetes Order II. bacterium]MBT6424747.1 FAD-dependent oxidoreductase [Bacteroidetes Order II. bacterium]
MKQIIVVVGGVASGPAAVAEARRTDPDARIVLIEKGDDISYGACEMPMLLSGSLENPERLRRFTPAGFADHFDVEVLVRHEVVRIHTETRKLDVVNVSNSTVLKMRYDKLILATGASAIIPESLRSATPDVFSLRSLEDARTIQDALAKRTIHHAVVIGGGYVGLDVVWALKERGIRVSILVPKDSILKEGLDEPMQERLLAHLRHHQVAVRDDRASGLEVAPDGRLAAVLTEAGEKIGCDLALIATGTQPQTQLGLHVRIKMGASQGYLVDDGMQTSEKGIWACGDCVEREEAVFGEIIHAPLSLNAFRSGRVAGRNAARKGTGRPARIAAVVKAAALALGPLEIGHTGWTEGAAYKLGKQVVSATIQHRSASSLSPHSDVHVHLVAETATGRLVGCQIAGGLGTSQRLNVVTALIRSGGTVDDLNNVDFVYAPRLAPAHDPLFVAARTLQKTLNASRKH